MLGHQRVRHLVEGGAGHHVLQPVEGQVDAVVGEPTLREVVGADALGAVAGADLGPAVGRPRGVLLPALLVVEPRPQQSHRARPVLVLRALLLDEDDGVGRQWVMRTASRSC